MNLESLALKHDYELALTHPVTGEVLHTDMDKRSDENKVVIGLHGSASKPYRDAMLAVQNRALKRKGKQATPEQLRDEGTELLVACTAYTKNLTLGTEAVTTTAAFRKLYGNPDFSWIREQVDAALSDVSNFLKS